MVQDGGQDGYLPSSRSVRLILIKPQRWGKLISLEGGPRCSTECSLLPCGKHMGSFLWSSLWEPDGTARGKPHNCVWAPLCLGIPGAFHSQIGPPWADSASIQGQSIRARAFPRPHRLPAGWLLGVFAPGGCGSPGSPFCLCDYRTSGLSHDHSSFMHLGRVVDFSICLSFYMLSEWNNNFQTSFTYFAHPPTPSLMLVCLFRFLI